MGILDDIKEAVKPVAEEVKKPAKKEKVEAVVVNGARTSGVKTSGAR